MKHIVLGYGDVGKAICEILGPLYEVTKYDPITDKEKPTGRYDVVHVCFPYSAKFIDIVNDYIVDYNPSLVIIHSTVAPGTTSAIKLAPCVHSPVRGRHPDMVRDIRDIYVKYFGGPCAKEAAQIFDNCGVKTKCFEQPETTELGKLFCNISWGLILAFTQEQDRICKYFGVRFEDAVTEFNRSRNAGLEDIGRNEAKMPVLYPGFIGGHCVMPNVNILMQEYPSIFLKVIQESNDRYGKTV